MGYLSFLLISQHHTPDSSALYRHRLTPAPYRQGTAVALLAHDATRSRDHHLSRARVRRGRSPATSLRPLLVSVVWLRTRLRLALERRNDDGLRRRERRIAARGP